MREFVRINIRGKIIKIFETVHFSNVCCVYTSINKLYKTCIQENSRGENVTKINQQIELLILKKSLQKSLFTKIAYLKSIITGREYLNPFLKQKL